MTNEEIAYYARLELARMDFFYYCQLKAPDFYKSDRRYLVELCHSMQQFYEGDDEILLINLPPRHGKSRSASLFAEWIFGKNKHEKIMTGSYNEKLSTTFAKSVRNGIQEGKADPLIPVFSDVFPGVNVKHGEASMTLWALEGANNSYLATSPGGTATGFGASILIIDDIIKDAKEAYNADLLAGHWEWFSNTIYSRLEEGGKIIIIMTRWASKDLAARVLEHFTAEGVSVKSIVMKALQDNGEMLCPEVLSRKSYDLKMKTLGPDIAAANYQQQPIDLKGKLYTNIKTYDSIPRDSTGKPLFTRISSYTDTADTGADYLCNIVYGEYEKEAYILDVYYTKDPMEKTEPETARRLKEYEVNIATIESNNGGRGFSRAIDRILRELGSNRTRVEWFHQGENKQARILSNSTWVMDHIYFPANWRDKYPEFYQAINSYQKEGKNKHDDAPDCLTGVAEKMQNNKKFGTLKKSTFGL